MDIKLIGFMYGIFSHSVYSNLISYIIYKVGERAIRTEILHEVLGQYFSECKLMKKC